MPVPPPPSAAHGAQYLPPTHPPPGFQQYGELPHLQYNGFMVPNPRAPPRGFGVPKVDGYNPVADAEAIKKACKGFGTDNTALINTLTKLTPLKMDALAEHYVTTNGKVLVDLLDKETSGYFGMGIHALATGPLAWDVELLYSALAGAGTDEDLLTEILLDRSSEDLYRLTVEFKHRYKEDLAVKIKGDLSGQTEKMFIIALNAHRPVDATPIDNALVEKDVLDLYAAGQARTGTDETTFFNIFLTRSRPHLSAVCHAYNMKYRSLTKVIKSEFSGHVRTALLFVAEGVKRKRDGKGIWRDAKLIDKAMVGFGTKDKQLVYRMVRAHWVPGRMAAIAEAYQRRTGKTLESRVKSEASGSYEKLMVALLKAQQH
ncbi:hypothetical protein DXG01_008383 [Tephrocybe rancida]|nr:hypothetical protein DXG01_008383 [Tephrocybe rancida]